MNDDPKWKRKLPTRIYDYNFKVGESYYKPEINFIDKRSYIPTSNEPPKSQTYAERFASKPWYGDAKGLPYDTSDSALSKPLVNRRAVSASRASSIMKDREDNVPPHIRVLRRSRNIEDEVKYEDKFSEKPRRYHFEEELEYKPSPYTQDLRRDLKKLNEKFAKAEIRSRRSSISQDQFEDLDSSIFAPISRTEQTETAYKRPPIAPRQRNVSFNEADPGLPPHTTTVKRVSVDEFNYRPPKSLENLKLEDYDIKVSARELRNMRRAKESEDLSENIRKSISKMRAHDVDQEAAYKYTRQLRSSSLDPFGDDSKYSAKQRMTRFNAFVYGVGKSSS